jgi:cytoskeleton protein RodZ
MTNQKELIPMLPGDLLRYHRERLGLTLEQASDRSRIKPGTLAAIESGDTADIPSVYLRGYIRNYARFLGLDPAELEDHMENVQGAEPDIQSVFSVESRRGRGEKWLKASSYLAASALIAALAWQFTHEAVRFSQGESQLMAGTSGAQDGSTEDRPEPGSDALPSGTHLNASIASVELLQQRSELSGKTTAEQAWAAIGGQGDAAPAAAGVHHLGISTSGDSWVEIVDGHGTQLEQDLIRAGNSREYDGDGPFQVMIGRASSVVLTLDGQPVDLGPYSRGDVARLTLAAEPLADSALAENPESR